MTSLAAPAVAGATSYIGVPNATPNVDSISDGSVPAPWNTSQGITSFTSIPAGATTPDTVAISPYPAAALLPSFSFAGEATSSTPATASGAPVEPNVAVYPAASGDEPFPSGFAGTPGPLSGYCGTSYDDSWDTGDTATAGNPNETATPVDQPAGENLPFSPYYFPYVVTNADGSLTGYFDWRPKDANEGIVVARSTDGGKNWTSEGEVLEQNPGYCPSVDTNDDGEGHPYVANLGSGSNSYLYTLQRAVGDYSGSSLDVFPADPSASNPLSGVQSTTSVGVDPNTFATGATTAPATGGTAVDIPVNTLGGDAAGGNSTSVSDGTNTLTQPDVTALPTGAAEYEDLTGVSAGTQPPVITCAGSDDNGSGGSPELTGCTSASGNAVAVAANDDLVEVIATSPGISIPTGPQDEAQGAGAAKTTLNTTSANSDTLMYMLNANAPNRYYINGDTVYCAQNNAEPTTEIEDCTTPTAGGDTVAAGTPVTADPVIPSAGPNYTGGPVQQTNGLIAPDGIVGPLPSSANSDWDKPSTGKVVLYTEKKVNYFIEGGINGLVSSGNSASYINWKTAAKTGSDTFSTLQTGSSSTLETGYVPAPGSDALDYNISPFPTEAEKLPATGSFKVYIGGTQDPAGSKSIPAQFETLTCTGWDVNTQIADLYNPSLNTIDLIGCTGGNGSTDTTDANGTGSLSLSCGSGCFPGADGFNAGHQGNWVAGPGASIESGSVLQQTGEGKAMVATQAQKLFGNNEDYEVLRAAYTTDGVNFTDLGPISGSDANADEDSGSYTDISNPDQQDSPAGTNSNNVASNELDPNNPQGDSPTSLAVGESDDVELRWPGARGTIITNPDGSIGMFLSGAWASDGDSDAFNQIFYTQSGDGGKTWSVPKVVLSTDYTFSASVAQDQALSAGDTSEPLGVSAYYSGRAYDPTVVQDANGVLTLVFAGYRVPSPVSAAGTPIGTNTAAQYTEEATVDGSSQTDPAIYRNILTETLSPQIAPKVTTGAASGVSTTGATIAGTVLPYAQDTTYQVAYGTSPSSLGSTTSSQSAGNGVTEQTASATLSGLSPNTTYYYELQATNASGTTDGSVQSFTTGGSGTTTTGTTTTTTGTTTTTTTTTGTTTTGPGGTTKPKPKPKTVTVRIGNQKLTLTLASGKACVAPSKKLRGTFKRVAVKGGTKLTFVGAAVYIGKGVKHTKKVKRGGRTVKVTTYSANGKLKKATDSFALSLKGRRKGTDTLRVVVTYREKGKTVTKTISGRFSVC